MCAFGVSDTEHFYFGTCVPCSAHFVFRQKVPTEKKKFATCKIPQVFPGCCAEGAGAVVGVFTLLAYYLPRAEPDQPAWEGQRKPVPSVGPHNTEETRKI